MKQTYIGKVTLIESGKEITIDLVVNELLGSQWLEIMHRSKTVAEVFIDRVRTESFQTKPPVLKSISLVHNLCMIAYDHTESVHIPREIGITIKNLEDDDV